MPTNRRSTHVSRQPDLPTLVRRACLTDPARKPGNVHSAVLAKYREPDGAPITLRVWRLPEALTESYAVRDMGGAMILEEDAAPVEA